MALLLSVLEQGMIYGILALGVYITYKILYIRITLLFSACRQLFPDYCTTISSKDW